MCQVEWFIEVIPYLPETAIKVLSILAKSHRQGVTPQGRPVLTSSLSLQELSRRAGLSRRGAQQGLAVLEESSLMTRHLSRDPRGPTTYSIPLTDPPLKAIRALKRGVQNLRPPKRMRGAKFAPLNNPVVDDVDKTESDLSKSTTNKQEGRQICTGAEDTPLVSELHTLGELRPEELLERYGPDQVEGALRYLKSRPRTLWTNPPGWLRNQLDASTDFTGHKNLPQHSSWDTEPTNKYLRGKYGHVVQH